MATVYPVYRKRKGRGFKAVVRKEGYRPISKTFKTKGEAEVWGHETEKLIELKLLNSPEVAKQVLLTDALQKYSEYLPVTKEKKPSTLEREKYSRKHLERLLGEDTPLFNITQKVVANYQNERLQEGSSPSSVRQELAMLSKMFRKAKTDWGLPVENPTEGIERVSPNKGRTRFSTEQEAIVIINETQKSKNARFYPFILLLMHTGMRTGEAARLSIEKINFEKKSVVIEETKSGLPRSVPLTDRSAKALQNITPFDTGHYFLKKHHLESSRIMLKPGAIFKECWTHMWKRVNKSHPHIEKMTMHDLRHTAASHLINAGVDIRVVADILGHSTLQMAMRYTHLMDKTTSKVMGNLNHLGFEEK